MPLCFIEPQEAIRVVAESVGREARRQLLGEVVRAWVDEIPDDELQVHYAKAVEELDDDDLSILAAWHASLEVGQPIANKEFLLGRLRRPRRAPPRGAADRRGLPGRRRLRGRRQRGAGARHRAALALGRAPGGARRRGGGAVLLGPPGLGQLAGCGPSPGCVLGVARARERFTPPSLACSVFARLLVAARRHYSRLRTLEGWTRALRRRAGCGRRARRVTKHTDGDTLWLSGIGKVRLIGVDTPEVYGGSSATGARRRPSWSGCCRWQPGALLARGRGARPLRARAGVRLPRRTAASSTWCSCGAASRSR